MVRMHVVAAVLAVMALVAPSFASVDVARMSGPVSVPEKPNDLPILDQGSALHPAGMGRLPGMAECAWECVGILPYFAAGDTGLDLLPREMKLTLPLPDADGDGLDDFWLFDLYVNEDRETTVAELRSSGDGGVLRSIEFEASWAFPAVTLTPDGHLVVLTGIGPESNISAFWLFRDRVTYSDSCGGFTGWSSQLLVIDDDTGKTLWSKDYPIEVGPGQKGSYSGSFLHGPEPFLGEGAQVLLHDFTFTWNGCIWDTGVYDVTARLLDLESWAYVWEEELNDGFGALVADFDIPKVGVLPTPDGPLLVTINDDQHRRIDVRSAVDFKIIHSRGEAEMGVRPDRVHVSLMGDEGVLLVVEESGSPGMAAAGLHWSGDVLWTRSEPFGYAWAERLDRDDLGNELWRFDRYPDDGEYEMFAVRISDGTERWRVPWSVLNPWGDPEPQVGEIVHCGGGIAPYLRGIDLDADGTADPLYVRYIECNEYIWLVPMLVPLHVHSWRDALLASFSGSNGELLLYEFIGPRLIWPALPWGTPRMQSTTIPFLELPNPEESGDLPESAFEWFALTTYDLPSDEWRRTIIQERTYLTTLEHNGWWVKGPHDEWFDAIPVIGSAGAVDRYIIHWTREEFPLLLWGTPSYARFTTTAIDAATNEILWQISSDHLDLD